MKNYFVDTLKKNSLVAAPLAGITNKAFRTAIRRYHDGIIFTEMISVEGVVRGIPQTLKYMDITEEETPIHIQLFGYKPNSFYDAVRICEESTLYVDSYNVNMGCPVKKVHKTGGGAGLLKDIDNISRICEQLRKSTNKPVSIKIRLGWNSQSYIHREIVHIAESEGIDAVIVHGRTKEQMFRGEIDYDKIQEMVDISKYTTIIGNGNVFDFRSYNRMMETGVSGVMLARGMMQAPWLFEIITRKLDVSPMQYLTPEQSYELLQHITSQEEIAAKKLNQESYKLPIIKKYAVFFAKSLPNAAEYRKQVYSKNDYNHFWQVTERFFLNN